MKNVIKASLIVMMVLPVMSFASSWKPVEEGKALSGKIHAVKTTRKYRSVEKCRAFADSKPTVVAFTFDQNKSTCTTFTSVRSRPERDGAFSQEKG